MALISALVSLGCTGIYSAMLPLTFKFGPDNHHGNCLFMIIIYFIFYILAVIIAAHYDNSMVEMLSNIRSLLVFVVSLAF